LTAEVAILNREAVALGADSAVTLTGGSGQKIFTSANKIFQLSKIHPVGVMLYDSATIAEVSWETIIKRYRDQLGNKSFATLPEYATDFLTYLEGEKTKLFPADLQVESFQNAIHAFLHLVRDEIRDAIDAERIQSGKRLTQPQVDAIVANVVQENQRLVMAGRLVPGLPKDYISTLRRAYGRYITQHIDSVLGARYTLTPALRRRLRLLLLNLFLRVPPDELEPPFRSGLVFAGFGDDDLFPRLREITFEGVVGDYIKSYPRAEVDIELIGVRATVIPFAQRDMVQLFMEGVDPDYQDLVEGTIEDILRDLPDVLLAGLTGARRTTRDELRRRAERATAATMHTIHTHLAQVRKEAFWSPIAELVNLLPKEELGSMAEALVNLTSFRRRVSWDAETVGGPVDVAVISRGDGFVWMKRKHYFAPELNPGFMLNRYGVRP
jgi:hypothetical protein